MRADRLAGVTAPGQVEPSALFDERYAYVERVTLRNFRGIGACTIELEPDLTVLAGRNNAGKSRVLAALQLAIGGRPADVDDFTVGLDEEPQVDVVVAPWPREHETDDDEFPASVARLFEGWVQSTSEDPLRERVAWRTTIRRSGEGYGARSETRILTFDDGVGLWVQRQDAPSVERARRGLFAVDLIGTGRDLMEELGRRGSAIRKVLSDLEVPEEEREELEADLSGLNTRILQHSQTLASVAGHLSSLHQLIGSMGAPALNPIPARLEELARLISIDLDTGSGALPMRMHGAGTRSMASLQVQSVLYDRRLGRDGTSIPPTPLTLVEEPEAHLHPQACGELAPVLELLRGQKVVTTHSPHLITSVSPSSLRLLRWRSGSLEVVDLGPATDDSTATHRGFRPSLHVEEMEKMKRLVERPFGDVMFASVLLLGDGATERALLPPLLRHALGNDAHGICVIDPGSLGNELARALVKFATMTGTPWVAFADADVSGQEAIDTLAGLGDGDPSRVVWVNGVDAAGNCLPGALEDMLRNHDENMCRDACLAVRPDLGGLATARLMKKTKGSAGASLAAAMITSYPDESDWPQPIQDLLTRVRAEI